MTPMFLALLCSFGLSAVLAVGWVAAIDRNDARNRARRGMPITVTPLPMALARPAAWRRRRG